MMPWLGLKKKKKTTVLNNNGEGGDPCLIFDLGENAFHFSPLRIMCPCVLVLVFQSCQSKDTI